MSQVRTVLQTQRFHVVEQVCQRPRVNCGHVDGDEPARIVFTRRGAFSIRIGKERHLARPGNAVFVSKDTEFHIHHPDIDGCDCCMDLRIGDAVVEMLGLSDVRQAGRSLGHGLRFQALHAGVAAGLRARAASVDGNPASDAGSDPEDILTELLSVLFAESGQPAARTRRAGALRKVARVQEAIVGAPARNLDLHTLAAIAGCSPFHLCNIFRSVSGSSLRQFRLEHRLGNAIGQLADGQHDLMQMAIDLGFNSHSHMSQAFRAHLGRSPAWWRSAFDRGDLARLRH